MALVALVAVAGLGLIASALGIVQTPVPIRLVSIAVLVGVVLVAIAGGRGVRRISRPMGQLIEAAGRIESGDYSAHVHEYGPRELRSVARAFNSMSARLKASDEQRRSFLADVAHELRTPLSVIRGQAEAIADGVYPGDSEHLAPILDATHTLDVLVEDLRTLALTDAGSLVLNREAVDPAALVHETVASFKAQADGAGIALSAEIAHDVPMADVDPARLRGVLANLVSNSLHYPRAGGSIRLMVAASGDEVLISVTDNGEWIAPDLLPRVFDRFVRGRDSTGSGLGLAIAHDIVTAHGGTIVIESALGSGTTVRLNLPAVPPNPRS